MRRGRVLLDGESFAVDVVDGTIFATQGSARPGRSFGTVDAPAARILPPVSPRTILGVMGGVRPPSSTDAPPRLFFKSVGALGGHDDPIVIPAHAGRVVAEGEIGLVIGRECVAVEPEDAWRHVAGMTIVNDVTAVDILRRDGDFLRGKCQRGFAPVGPWVADAPAESSLVEGIDITVRLNGDVVSVTSTSSLVSQPSHVVSRASHTTPLIAGDIVHLGCVAAIEIVPGDIVEITVDDIGTLTNPVVASG